MDKKELQGIIVRLKDLVEELECEVMSDPSAYIYEQEKSNFPEWCDDDDDGYCD